MVEPWFQADESHHAKTARNQQTRRTARQETNPFGGNLQKIEIFVLARLAFSTAVILRYYIELRMSSTAQLQVSASGI